MGLAVDGVVLADGGGGGAGEEGEEENGRSGKRALERVVVEIAEKVVGREAMEGLAEGEESGEEVEGRTGEVEKEEVESELELKKTSVGKEVGMEDEGGKEPLSVGESEEGKVVSGKSVSMSPWDR